MITEATQTYTLSLAKIDAVLLGPSTTLTITIPANDLPSISIAEPTAVTLIEGGNATLTVEINRAMNTPLNITLSAEPSDQITIPNTITILANQRSVDFPITAKGRYQTRI